jgi:hypothetical protein
LIINPAQGFVTNDVGSESFLLLHEGYVWVSLGNAMKAKQATWKQAAKQDGPASNESRRQRRLSIPPRLTQTAGLGELQVRVQVVSTPQGLRALVLPRIHSVDN